MSKSIKLYRLILHDPKCRCMASQFKRFTSYDNARLWALDYAEEMCASAVELAVKCYNRYNHYNTIEVIDL